jgi:AcrR family transcriptional regulator
MQSQLPSTPAERRRFRQREDARRAILDATEALLVGDGYEGFSMRRLAARCGYTAPTIYHHFGDKQGLLDAVLDERLARVLERLRGVRHAADPARTVRAMLLEFARFGIENPTHHRLLSMPRPDDSPPPPAAEEIRLLFEQPLAELAAAGRLRAPDVEEATQCVWALLHGLVSLRVTRPDVEWKDAILEFAFDTVLRGLVAPTSPGDAS